MISVLVLLVHLAVQAAPEAPASDLAPAAQPHNLRGIAHIEAGEYATGVDELERAYALMPDPLRYRAGRSKVLGSLRSALNHLYQTTGDPAHLRRLQGHLLRHLEALVAALGDGATPDDTAGSLAALHEVEQTLASAPAPAPTPSVVPPPRRATPRPPPPTPEPTAPRHAPPAPLRPAGSAVLGVGFVALGVMTYAVVVHADSRHKLRALTRSVDAAHMPPSPRQHDEADSLFRRANTHRTLAIVTGTVAGAAVITGIVLHALARRRARGTGVAHLGPTLAPGFAGLDMHLRF